MSRLFTARDAKELTKETKDLKINSQREKYLERIKLACRRGETFIQISDDHGYEMLSDEDYQFFLDLGYTVTKPKQVFFMECKDKTRVYVEDTPYNKLTSKDRMHYEITCGSISW